MYNIAYVSSSITQSQLQPIYTTHHLSRQIPYKPINSKQQTSYIYQQHHPQSLQFVYLQSPSQQQQQHQEQQQSNQGGVEELGHSTTQHHSSHSAVTGGVQYAEPQDNDAYTVVQDEEQQQNIQQNKIPREDPVAVYQHQQHQNQVGAVGAGGYLQYVPVATSGP